MLCHREFVWPLSLEGASQPLEYPKWPKCLCYLWWSTGPHVSLGWDDSRWDWSRQEDQPCDEKVGLWVRWYHPDLWGWRPSSLVHHVTNDSINHIYKIKPQQKLWTPGLGELSGWWTQMGQEGDVPWYLGEDTELCLWDLPRLCPIYLFIWPILYNKTAVVPIALSEFCESF